MLLANPYRYSYVRVCDLGGRTHPAEVPGVALGDTGLERRTKAPKELELEE